MVKRFAKLFALVLISIFVVSPSTGRGQQKNSETYEAYLARIRKEIQPLAVQFMISTPMREGRPRTGGSSGFVIFEQKNQADINGKIVKYVSYYILSTPHIVSEQEVVLKNYQEANIRISVLGKTKIVYAQIVAWEWGSDSLLLKVDVLENELDDFKKDFNLQVVKLAKKLPEALFDSKYTGKDVPSVYLSGYPARSPVANSGYISQYSLNYDFNDYTTFAKVAYVDISGSGGSGQSGAPVFNQNLEVVGMVVGDYVYRGINFAVMIPIDVIIERFLKKLQQAELKGIDLPNFELDKTIKDKPIFLGKPKNTINN